MGIFMQSDGVGVENRHIFVTLCGDRGLGMVLVLGAIAL